MTACIRYKRFSNKGESGTPSSPIHWTSARFFCCSFATRTFICSSLTQEYRVNARLLHSPARQNGETAEFAGASTAETLHVVLLELGRHWMSAALGTFVAATLRHLSSRALHPLARPYLGCQHRGYAVPISVCPIQLLRLRTQIRIPEKRQLGKTEWRQGPGVKDSRGCKH